MGSFNNKISAEFNPPRKWVLERALSYKNENIDIKALEAVGLNSPAHRVTCKKGFTTDKYSKGMVRALKVGGFDVLALKDKQALTSSNSGGQRKTGNIFSNFMGGVKSFFGFGDKSESNNKKTKTQNKVNAVTPAGAKTRILDQMTKEHVQNMLSKVPRGRFLEIEEFTSLVCWLSSEENTFSTAAVFDISGGRSTY